MINGRLLYVMLCFPRSKFFQLCSFYFRKLISVTWHVSVSFYEPSILLEFCNTTMITITFYTQGSSGTAFARFLPPAFQNGLGPRQVSSSSSFPLRNPRTISNTVFVNTSENVGGVTPNFTHMTMLWGSFIDHDFTLTVSNATQGCGTNDAPCPTDVPGCVSIPISQADPDDRLKNNQSVQCIPLSRSAIKNGEQVGTDSNYSYGFS